MTIAYSDKYQTWVSRYSFEPTCYSTIGNSLVSFNDDGGVWSHDTNDSRCNFYGDQAEASIQVCSNQDPSAVKMFKSISLETNGTGWSGKVYTNDEYSGNEKQEGDILESFFKNKEGFKYAEMPRSKINSSNVIVLGPALNLTASVYNQQFPYTPLHSLIQENISVQGLFLAGNAIASPSGTLETFDFDIPSRVYGSIQMNNPLLYKTPDGEIQELPGVNVVGYGDNFVRLSVLVNQEGVPYPFEPLGSTFYFPELNTALGDALYSTTTFGEEVTIIGMIGNATLFVSYNSEVEGDQMRGPYSRIELKTSTDKPFELHAINVDYEFSKLDKRLTQNS